ncbi:cytochrome P450 [Sistotremastrum suecicum HHB10207 ss-3]|uniref:Cytochrome P450 n=1 Tax=Sistotremastrum suecicum HHB10207 ss-3 TaxID=1314776 RepID=A0A166DZ53_9AGAM|nr:cytochrome P450 [Sistotremastrum suecicum HHB10207 ss-3]
MLDFVLPLYGHPWTTALAVVFVYLSVKGYVRRRMTWVDVPAVGPTGILTSYLGAIRYFRKGDEVLQEGYDKYSKGGIFKVPDFSKWTVIVSSSELLEELRKAPDDQLSFEDAMNDMLQLEWVMGREIIHNNYHLPLFRTHFTRDLGLMYPDIIDEIGAAFSERISPQADEWISVKTLDTMQTIIARCANRTFVGLPLCRDQAFLDLNTGYAVDVVAGAEAIRLFPNFLKPLVARLYTPAESTAKKVTQMLRPVIEERLAQIKEEGKLYVNKPVDFLSLLLDYAEGQEREPENLAKRVLSISFAAISSTSMTFAQVVFFLASMPEYAVQLREEVESVTAEEGWTQEALSKCYKIDSFVKECQRFRGAGLTSSMRMAVNDYTFSNGTVIPKGTFVTTLSVIRHKDPQFYGETAKEFDGFRFSKMRENGESIGQHQAVSIGTDFLPYGIGRHACPGRFFAALMMKSMLAHIVLNYDIKMASGKMPESHYLNSWCIPDASAEVMFRKRRK